MFLFSYIRSVSEYITNHDKYKTPYLIICGNISDHIDFRLFLSYCSNDYKKVFYIPGDLDYNNLDFVKSECLRYGNIFVLDNKNYILYCNETNKYLNIIGSTLWSNIDKDLVINNKYNLYTNLDYSVWRMYYLNSLEFIESSLLESKYPSIVITYFLPSYNMISDSLKTTFKGTESLIATDLEYLFRQKYNSELKIWLCGHIVSKDNKLFTDSENTGINCNSLDSVYKISYE